MRRRADKAKLVKGELKPVASFALATAQAELQIEKECVGGDAVEPLRPAPQRGITGTDSPHEQGHTGEKVPRLRFARSLGGSFRGSQARASIAKDQ